MLVSFPDPLRGSGNETRALYVPELIVLAQGVHILCSIFSLGAVASLQVYIGFDTSPGFKHPRACAHSLAFAQ